jgi:FlaA1/EpsC-like NDP-sugar epimerase
MATKKEALLMSNVLSIIGRDRSLFSADREKFRKNMEEMISASRFLVIGGAGSIGSSIVLELFKSNPKLLHVVDISENNLVELVRDIRSSVGYNRGEFATYTIDCGSDIFNSFVENGPGYDYVFNIAALKHVRSERDPFTLMRMIDVNVLYMERNIRRAKAQGAKKYFCVSTDKAANPVNMMGASKRIMEMFLMRDSMEIPISTARFANVAFSDGSLLFGFNRRLEKGQPLSVPLDLRRYFMTYQESGELCLMSCLLGENRDIFFPKLDGKNNLVGFCDIAGRYLESVGFEPVFCDTEDEARRRVAELKKKKKYPVYCFKSNTTGEKDVEEFYTGNEVLDTQRFSDIGIIKNEPVFDQKKLEHFTSTVAAMRKKGQWTRGEMISLFAQTVPEFKHRETGVFLDEKM